MIFAALLPLAIWSIVAPRWHWLLIAISIVIVLAVGARLLSRVLRARAAAAGAPIRPDHRWRPGWTADYYAHHLLEHLRLRSWRVEDIEVIGPDRITILARRERQVLALLCLRPGTPAEPADADSLAFLQARPEHPRAILITDTTPSDTRLAGVPYATLRDPLDLWPPEQPNPPKTSSPAPKPR